MPLDLPSAAASMGLYAGTAFLTGWFLLQCVLKPSGNSRPSILITLCLATGIAVNALVSLLAGLFWISALVPLAFSGTLGLLAALITWMHARGSGIHAYLRTLRGDIPGLLVLVLSFAYFVLVAGLMEWPPPGDVATAHGPMVTLFLAAGRIPLTEQGYVILYPPGLQALAASIGPVVLRYGGEMVFSLGAVLAALLAPLAYAIMYRCTSDWRWAVVAAVVPLIPHPSGNLEEWTVGYFFNGPYPNLFGYVIVLTLVGILMIEQRPSTWLGNWRRLTVAALVTLACVFVYPGFAILSIPLVGIWVLLERAALRAELGTLVRARRAMAILVGVAVGVGIAVVGYLVLLTSVGQNPSVILDYLLGRFVAGYGGAPAAPTPYMEHATFFVDHVSGWISLFAMVAVAFRIRRRTWDLLDLFYLIFGLALLVSLTGPGFALTWPILPSRSGPLFVLLGWPVLLRAIAGRITAATAARGTGTQARGLASGPARGATLPVLVLALVILTPVVAHPVLGSALVNPVGNYGWFSDDPSFPQDFQTLEWIVAHADHNALMANDGSYLSRYLPSLTLQNMSNSVWDEARFPQRARDLTEIWNEPRNVTYLVEMLRMHQVKYLFATSETGFVVPFENSTYAAKLYPPRLLDTIFDHYSFLTVDYATGWNRVYEVRSTPTIATVAVLANATSGDFWNLRSAAGSGSIGLPRLEPNGTINVTAGAFAGWTATHSFVPAQNWTNALYLSAEIRTATSLGLTIYLTDGAGRTIWWNVITLAGRPTMVDLPLRNPDGGRGAMDLGSVSTLAIGNGTFGVAPDPGDGIAVGGLALSG
ncbi:MAG TPA: hypothetical protein VEY12_12405 [Thermoplasmata archaeon]|nr:hypothetical protein [Thermoplasmata archaeon]